MKFRKRTLDGIAECICGNLSDPSYFPYRSSFYLTRFFQDAETDYVHDSTTRSLWVSGVLEDILSQPWRDQTSPPAAFLRVINVLMDAADAEPGDENRSEALKTLNLELRREGFEAFYADDDKCYLRHVASKAVAMTEVNPHRPWTPAEISRRDKFSSYLDECSEDDLIAKILLPLFRQLGFQRITATDHKDKSLEYGKDIWMKYSLPTQHFLYFGLQVKKGKLDSAGMSRKGSANVAEILNQITMMLGHTIFDPEINKKVLVDHVYIVAGGEITKAARNWLGENLDASKRSQVMFMDRNDILDLCIVTNILVPQGGLEDSETIPF